MNTKTKTVTSSTDNQRFMRRWIFILISILTLSACHSGGQKDDALSDVDIKVIRYDRLQYEAFALNSFSACRK